MHTQDASLISGLRKPTHADKVYKDECMFCFDTPLSAGGLYLNLATFQARAPDATPAPAALSPRANPCLCCSCWRVPVFLGGGGCTRAGGRIGGLQHSCVCEGL
jgi:hypothetical protein